MVHTEKVSVIVPFYNGGDTIKKTLEGIFAQSYKNLEVVLVSDGSPDPVAPYLIPFTDESRLVVIEQENGGVAAARNTGIKAATGDFIAFCDQDDIWHSNKLSEQMPFFEQSEVGLVYTGTEAINTKGHSELIIPAHEGQCFFALCKKNFITCCTVVVRKSLIENIGYFNAERALQGVDDRFVWMQLARLCDFAVVKKPLATYVIHGGNYSLNNRKMLTADVYCIKTLSALPDLTAEEAEALDDALTRVYIHYANNFLYRDEVSDAGRCYLKAWTRNKLSLSWLVIGVLLYLAPVGLVKQLKRLRKSVIS
ncbi:glycosyltransferase [Aestuariibacter sp. A3R04]|uniref:glycosyltransferase family 2 protein n=1 Tax=Aestuariibacter sp. A3R04 TaxID=2841571 RepID=UPI001C082B44|nr:glycosyltransferase [Aestuariibacter sp. A3R04]MBU3021747.1 glycosyltransferase [Aestuariibacter sp. A3R04]